MPKPDPVIKLRKPPTPPTNLAAADAFVGLEAPQAVPLPVPPAAAPAPQLAPSPLHAVQAAPAVPAAPAAPPLYAAPPAMPVAPHAAPPVPRQPAPVSVEPTYITVPRRRMVVQRQDGRTLHRTTIYLPPDLSRQLALRAAQTNRTQSDLIIEALRRYFQAAPEPWTP